MLQTEGKGSSIWLRAFLSLSIGIAVGLSKVQAQQASSPLAGKTVHVYNPFGQSLPLINLSGVGHAMTPESGNWYRLSFDSLGGALQPWMDSFGIRTGDWKWLIATGVGTTEGSFGVDVFGTSNDVWIVVDPAGPATAAPRILTTAPRTLHFFNPWPVTGADLMLNGTKRALLSDRTHCGWEAAYILDAGPATGYFVNSVDGEAYGKSGLKDSTPIDFAALFASHGPDVWIGGASGIAPAFPGDKGSCEYLMATTVHDMAETHPDYSVLWTTPGMVNAVLGPDRKPVPTSLAPPNFNTWFNADANAPMPLKGAQTCLDLEMKKSDDGLWEFDSNNDPVSGEFFPIDHWNVVDRNSSCSSEPAPPQSSIHNYGFCLESHATFVYKKGQVFDFRGDDDVWVFIDNKLALDLGGIHPPTDGRIDLDTLGLTEGQSYPWDFFFCERNKCGSSLRIKTTIYFKQKRALDHAEEKLPGGGSNYRGIKRIGGTGACGSSGDSITEVTPGPLGFVLYRAGGDSIQTLPKGGSFGGITVGDAGVSVDTAKVTGLPPGTYRIVFFEISNPNLRDEIRFTVPAGNVMVFEEPLSQTAQLGNAIRVTAGNYFRGAGKDSLVAGAAAWTPVFPTHLSVYTDSSRSNRIASGTRLTTAGTGLDTLWVYGDPSAVADRTDSLSIPGSNRAAVTFTLPPLDLPLAVSAAVYDDDGDGRGDRLQVVFDRDISDRLPESVAYRWPSSTAPVTVSANAGLAQHLRGGDTLVFGGAPLTSAVLTEGAGSFASTYKARARDSIQRLDVVDRIAPVITGATIHPGGAWDTLRLAFSEPLAGPSRSAPAADLFSYKTGDSGAVTSFAPGQTVWSPDGLWVQLIFTSNLPSAPRAGDLVRLNGGPGLGADALGNMPGPESRFRLILGEKRLGIQTKVMHHIAPEASLLASPVFLASLEGSGADIQDAIDRTGRIGVLMEAELADFAAGDGLNPPSPASVRVEYELAVFTNLGVPVASEKRAIACNDGFFDGDCRRRRGRLFVGWNQASKTGSLIGTGAYVVLFNFRIVSQGKVVASNGIRQIWGVLRAIRPNP